MCWCGHFWGDQKWHHCVTGDALAFFQNYMVIPEVISLCQDAGNTPPPIFPFFFSTAQLSSSGRSPLGVGGHLTPEGQHTYIQFQKMHTIPQNNLGSGTCVQKYKIRMLPLSEELTMAHIGKIMFVLYAQTQQHREPNDWNVLLVHTINFTAFLTFLFLTKDTK